MSKGTILRIVQAVALIAAGVWLLSGCGEFSEYVNEDYTWSGTLTEVPFTLKDGREITCVTFENNARSGGGIDCDWGEG